MSLQGLLIEDHNHDTLIYAGGADVRVTDWFFFKKNIELKYIGLENALIKMQRQDSVWNHQFLVDYFSSPSSSGKKKGGTHLNLKKIDLKNVAFIKKDKWLGQDMTVVVSSLDLNAKNIDFTNKNVDLNSLTIINPLISIYNYPKLKPPSSNISPEAVPEEIDSSLKWNAAGWVINASKLEIKNGIFKNEKYSTAPVLASFDGRHIEFSKINTRLTTVHWEKDTITASLNLQTKERSGFEVKEMKADVKVTPQEMAFSNMEIKTNNSIIRDYFRMSYDDFSSMNDFIDGVNMQANFADSHVDSDDIGFFAPALQSWKKNIKISGEVRGPVSDLVGKNMIVQAGNNTSLNGDFSLTGLPEINQTFIDFKTDNFKTTYGDAAAFVPAIRKVTSPDLRQLEYIHFKGSFTGFIRDFVTFGVIETNLGTVKSDLNMKLPANQPPLYSGTIATESFQLGNFLRDPALGAIALNGSIKGSGFKDNNRQAEMDGKIKFVDYNGYRYSNATIKGTLDKLKFDGIASIADPEIEFNLNGLINFNTKTPVFNFIADVKKANLQKLNLIKDSIAFNGKLNLNFTGDNIDNFLGYANITDATLSKKGNRLPFDSLIVSSGYVNNEKRLKATSNEFEASLAGNFTIRDLPDAFKLFLNKYYPSYIKPPKHVPANESLTFDISTQNVDEYIKLIDSSLTGFNYSHINGTLNTNTSEFTLNGEVPQFKYKNYNFDNVNIVAKGNDTDLILSGSAANINISDSLNIPLAVFNINAGNDISKVQITTGINQAINQAKFNAQVFTYPDGVKIAFEPSTFSINGKTWTLDENGELEFRNKMPATGQLILRESNQQIVIRSKPSETGNNNDLLVELKDVNAGDFAPIFLPKNRLEGLVSGNITIEDPVENLFISSDNIEVQGLRLDNDSIGNAKATLSYNGKTKELKAKGNSLDEENNLAFDLDLFFDKEKQKNNLIAIKTKSFKIKFLERFLGDLFSDMEGYVTGDFDIRGEFNQLQITGKGRLHDAGLKVNFTQCFYKIQDTEIELKPTEINLDGIVLIDPVTGNPIYIVGGIQHTAFKKMFFDLVVSTRKPNTTDPGNNRSILLLNTGYNDNKQFYGRVKGTGSFSLSGYESDMLMKIDAIASTTDSSIVTIPSSKSRESGIADFLIERKYGREMEEEDYGNKSANIIYDVDVTANPMVTVRLVLDDLTGDEIKGRGSGTLNIHSGTNEKLSIRGRFDIEEGDYLFTFQSFFKKPFEIRKEADNYISWSGDPYNAKIRFEAVYTAKKVSFAPLANTLLNTDPAYSKLREDVYVVVTLTGDLFKPDFKFGLEFPPNSQVASDFAITSNIQQIEKNENEINRQVTYLIVFNSFAPQETAQNSTVASGGIGSTINELTYSTISSLSGLFFNEINKKLNSELARILKTDNIGVNFSGAVYNRNLLDQQTSNGLNINQSTLNVNVPISMFKDRFIITLGSTLDVPLQQATIQQNVQFLPDVTAEWLINQSGTIRASFFYKQNLDYLTTSSTGAARTKRSGASIAYRKEFDNLSGLFSGKKKKKRKTDQPQIEEQEVEKSDTTGGSN